MPSVRKQTKNQTPIEPDNPVESQQSHEADPIETVSDDLEELLETEDEQPVFFQAIGTIYGKVIRNEEGQFYIALGRQDYKLFILRHRYRAWLKQFENSPDIPLYLKVYPKILIIPRQPVIISFQVVAWSSDPFQEQESEPGMFIFKGIWQFLPQFKTPVISVYRNANAVDPTEKFKATHLPVLMRRTEEDIRPFRFNPKIPKDQLPPRWFIQARYKFIPSRECFGWVEDLEPPSQAIPRYKKPVKPAQPEGGSPEPKNFQRKSPPDFGSPQTPSSPSSSAKDKPKPKPVVIKPAKSKSVDEQESE
ncbi:conserved hypothetical protein [Gloeothece citriformis PCC 7424]|uniref:Uncharacterized protein n=2 Tax=Gloeothece TaxID=28070 RepID=B7KCL0_GLOC7|nr:conserved hypothetical protein [Gloeothece citriformis PCC 7424]